MCWRRASGADERPSITQPMCVHHCLCLNGQMPADVKEKVPLNLDKRQQTLR